MKIINNELRKVSEFDIKNGTFIIPEEVEKIGTGAFKKNASFKKN